jgi:hypothetical protein
MSTQHGDQGSSGWGMILRLAGGAASLPLIVGFVALGAVVVVGRSLRDVARVAFWRRFNSNGHPGRSEDPRPDAA